MTETTTPPIPEETVISEAPKETVLTEEEASQNSSAVEVNNTKTSKKTNNGKTKALKIPFGLSGKLFIGLCVLLAVIIGLSTSLAVTLNMLYTNSLHKAVYSKDSELTLTRQGDTVDFYNVDIGPAAIPAWEGVPKCTYKEENFRTDSKGLKYYYEDGELASYTGIDVSTYNGEIDFEAVKNFGIDFVIVRLGGRGYGEEGILFEDDYAMHNLRSAKAAGLMVGAYFFSQAITPEEAAQEANFCLDILDGFYLDYPLVFDWEQIDSAENPRTQDIAPEVLTNCAVAFCHTVKKAGYIPCLYTDSKKAYMKFDLSKLSDVDIWYAFYNDSPDMYYNYMMWQYSCTGQVDGIEGDVDLNICFKNY